ncbi:MAG: type II secretion system protein [Sulfuricurvum sp.]|nr:type II secretion system protein [Sulfuricurvum sp.]
MKSMKQHAGFTMIELLFVIVIMGIVGGLALEAIRQYYEGIYRTEEYSKRVAQADQMLEQIAHYFEIAISDSIIRLDENNLTGCYGIPETGDDNNDYTIAFVSVDQDGMRGFWDGTRWRPGWSRDGVAGINTLFSADANYTAMNNLSPLAASNTSRAAIFRSEGLGEGDNECERFGWESGGNTNNVYARIVSVDSDTNLTLDKNLNISGQAKRTYVMRTAYALRARDGEFNIYSGFEPWNNERYDSAPARLLGENVTHFTILYDNANTAMNSNVGNIYTLKICVRGLDDNLVDTNDSDRQICRERMVHVRY